MKTTKIDTDKSPSLPFLVATIESHKKMGKIAWKKDGMSLYLSEKQRNGNYIGGNDLRKELESQPVLNATVLDYLIEHPELYPEDWKGKYIYFWGTIFRDSDGDLCVRFGCWSEGRVVSDCDWLDDVWGGRRPAASLASAQNSDTNTSLDSLTLARLEKLETWARNLGYK